MTPGLKSPSTGKNIIMSYVVQGDAVLRNCMYLTKFIRIMFCTVKERVSFKNICFSSNITTSESGLNTLHGNTVRTYSEL